MPRWIAALLVCTAASAAPWTFRADFQHGFNGWMSYPLPQDIGFDPTLSVEQSILVRQVASAGQSRLSTGVIRPLHFTASAGARIRLRYTAEWPSAGATLKLLLAGEDGKRYEAPLPASGAHEVTVTGRDLHLPTGGTPIEAVAIVGTSDEPAKGSNNRIELREVEIDAERTPEVRLRAPSLLSDPDRGHVAADVIEPVRGLTVGSAGPVRIRLKDASGRVAVERAIAAGGPQTVALGPGPAAGLWSAHIENTGGATNFSFLVLGALPAHPRVLLSAERLAQLPAPMRNLIHEQASAQSAKLKDATASGALIAGLPAGQTLRPSFDGELTEYFQIVESYSNAIAWSALDAAMNRDAAALDSARRNLLAMASWKTWTPPRFASHGMHTYYETGIVAQRLALAYDLIATRLMPAEKQEVADAFWTKCIAPTIEEYFTYDRMPAAASNWMSNSVGGALAAAIATAGDVPGWRAREGVALAQLTAAYERNLRGLFPGDGSEMEPAGYEHFAMQGLSWGAAALRGIGIRPSGMPQMLEAFWSPYYEMVRPGLVLDTGDFNGTFRSLSGFAFGAEFGGIPALRALYDRVERTGTPDLLDLLCCSQPAAKPAVKAALSRIFPTRGSAVLRSGWTPADTAIELRAGPWFNHEHHDQGSFQVSAFGTKLISEAGYANYYLDPNYPGYFTQAPGHNTVLVDDDAFSQIDYDGLLWKALRSFPAFTDRLLSAHANYIAADLAPAYGERVSSYKRQYVFLPPDVFIVRDNLRAPESHTFSWLLHAAENAAVEAHGGEATIRLPDAAVDVSAPGRWEVQATPVPAAVTQILGNVPVHPGQQQGPRRTALRLSSPRSDRATFEVKMQFRRTSAATRSSQAWALFRSGTGDLRHEKLASDGTVFAGRSADQWLAIGTRSVRDGSEVLFTANAATNIAWNRSPSELTLDVNMSSPAAISIREKAAAVFVDEAPVRYRESNGRVELPSIPKGEHRVRISIRAVPQ
jgi:hypothetical protein